MERPDWVDDDLYPFADHWAELTGGTVIHYLDEGAGTPILMVHGNPTWSFLYRDIVRELRDDFRCVAIDLPGFGLSRPGARVGFRPAEHAAALAELIERLDLRDYLVMGQDWGGPIGLAAAGRAPERVAGLILGNTWAWSVGPQAYAWSWTVGGPVSKLAIQHLNAFVRVGMRLGTRRRRPSADVMRHYDRPFPTAEARRPTWQFAREVSASSDFLEQEAHAALDALSDRPALLPWGTSDPLFSAGFRERFTAALPRAETHLLEGAGHFIQEDAPGEIAAAVRSWWAREGARIPA